MKQKKNFTIFSLSSLSNLLFVF